MGSCSFSPWHPNYCATTHMRLVCFQWMRRAAHFSGSTFGLSLSTALVVDSSSSLSQARPLCIMLSTLVHGWWKHVFYWEFEQNIWSFTVSHAHGKLLYAQWQIHHRASTWILQVLILQQVSLSSSPIMRKSHYAFLLIIFLPLAWKLAISFLVVHSWPSDT